MLAFVISIDDFIITLMVAGAGSTTLPVYIYSMIRTGVTPEVNAVSTLLLAVSIVLVSGYWLLSSANRKGGAIG
jgi:spermidine/putrescine transport system permease protein